MSRVIRIHCDAADMGKVLAESVNAAAVPKELLCCGIWGYERQAGQQRCHTGFPRQSFPEQLQLGLFMVCNSLARRQWQSRIESKWLGTTSDINWHLYFAARDCSGGFSLLFRGYSCVTPSPVCSVAKQSCSRA